MTFGLWLGSRRGSMRAWSWHGCGCSGASWFERERATPHAACHCHYPWYQDRRDGGDVDCGKGVVTGGEIGLQASGGKGPAKHFVRAALVTRCYGALHPRLRKQRCRLKPTWAPQGVTVPHRCNGGARADAPQGTVGHIGSDGGLIQLNGQAAAARVLFGGRAGDRGSLPAYRAAAPWREAKQRLGG